MPTILQAQDALISDLRLRLPDVPVVAVLDEEPATGPLVVVAHKRDLFSPQQWDRVVTSEFTVDHIDSPGIGDAGFWPCTGGQGRSE